MCGIRLIAFKIQKFAPPPLISIPLCYYARFSVAKRWHRFMAVWYGSKITPQRDHIESTGPRRALYTLQYQPLVLNVMKHAVADNQIEFTVWDIITDIGILYFDHHRRRIGKPADLLRAYAAYLDCGDVVPAPGQPYGVGTLASTEVECAARRLVLDES